jgi:hypothetical protein
MLIYLYSTTRDGLLRKLSLAVNEDVNVHFSSRLAQTRVVIFQCASKLIFHFIIILIFLSAVALEKGIIFFTQKNDKIKFLKALILLLQFILEFSNKAIILFNIDK